MKHFYSKFLRLSFTVAGFALMSAQYSNGYIVSNEGNGGSSNAEISYIDANNNITNNVYSLANNGEALGSILQSIYFNGDKSYMVLNGSNKIVVANRASFVKSAVITSNLDLPRSTTIANGKVYTTNVGDFGNTTQFVSVHDATTLAYITSIPLSQDPEEIVTVNGKVYVMKASFGTGNSIEVIDPATDTITNTIVLSDGLQSMKVSGDDIFALCTSASGSTIYKVSTVTNAITASISNASLGTTPTVYSLKLALDGTKLYISHGLSVYTLNTDLAAFSNTPVFSVPMGMGYDEFYGFAAIDGKIFQGHANGFMANSTLKTYSQTGTVIDTYTTTMGINNILKNVFTPGSLSVSDTKLNNVISIYPNPVSEILYVKNADGAKFKIVDLSGRIVKSGVYQNGITVSDLNKGNYIIQISGKNVQQTEKFIIN